MKHTYLVVFEKGPTDYSGFAPDVRGCVSVGDTLDEIRSNFRQALNLYLEYSAEMNLPIPAATTRTVTLDNEPNLHAEYSVEWMTVDVPESASDPDRKAA